MGPVTLVLAGTVGSGKSTFAQAVVQNSQSSWRRVNQDSLGSRKQCMSVAKQSLTASTSVIIDRMNFDTDQRGHWVKLAADFHSPCYALCLHYPADICATRGADRLHHEGGVTGDKAKEISARMSKVISENMPTVAEGFEHVIIVTSDEEAAIVLRAWQEFQPDQHSDPSLVLSEIRSQLPRSAFISRGDTPFTLAGTKRDLTGCPLPQAQNRPLQSSLQNLPTHPAATHNTHAAGMHPGVQVQAAAAEPSTGHTPSGAEKIPQTSLGAAARPRVLPASLRGGLQTYTAAEASVSASKPSKSAEVVKPDPPVQVELKARRRTLPASLLPGGCAGASSSQHRPCITQVSRPATATTAETVASVSAEGHQAQLHADTAVPATASAANHLVSEGKSSVEGLSEQAYTPQQAPKPNAFSMMMSASRSKAAANSSRKPEKKATGSRTAAAPKRVVADSSGKSQTGAKIQSVFGWQPGASSAWTDVFCSYARDPEKYMQTHSSDYIEHDDRVLMIKDAYPKAKFHILVIARDSVLLDISCLRAHHVPLLTHMCSKAEVWFSFKKEEVGAVGYRIGFHWKPSMKQLHLHAVSRDYDSSCLKQPKHYRSFCSDFFRDADVVIDELKEKGRVHIDMQAINDLMKAPLKCLWCHSAMQNLPAMKRHINTCTQNPSVG